MSERYGDRYDIRERRMRDRDYNRDYYRDYGYPRDRESESNRGYRQYDLYGIQRDQGYDREDQFTPTTWTYTEYWIIPGPFLGIGPSDYQRSDDSISEDVNERLTRHGQIDARKIEVKVENGEVTLNGTVKNRRMKRMAEDVAESVMGVRDIHNRLRIQDHGQERGSMENRGQVRQGMEVVGQDGNQIGTVKEIRDNDFLVDRPAARDVFIPFDACTSIEHQIRINVRAEEVDNQGWKTPELV